jgi:ankyrin repeat protein
VLLLGNEEVVWLLIKNGVGLEMPIQEYRTPLMLAVDGEHQVLLWKRAKIHAKPERAGIAALSEAVETGKEYSVRLLSQYGPELEALVTGDRSLGLAAKQGNRTTVRELGAKGAKVDGDREVSSSLILAAENGHHCAMRALLELGASADAVHVYSNTALKAAAHNGHLEAVRVLLDRGASVEEHAKGKGKAAVAMAVKYEHCDVAQLEKSRSKNRDGL